jgi:hypothetical protein
VAVSDLVAVPDGERDAVNDDDPDVVFERVSEPDSLMDAVTDAVDESEGDTASVSTPSAELPARQLRNAPTNRQRANTRDALVSMTSWATPRI